MQGISAGGNALRLCSADKGGDVFFKCFYFLAKNKCGSAEHLIDSILKLIFVLLILGF